jgi:acetyltransferase-like isoleucine patch superfamily enzyme
MTTSRPLESPSPHGGHEFPARAGGQLESAVPTSTHRLFAIRLINYLTNYVVNRVPSLTLRRLWYRRVLGVSMGEGAGIHLGCYVWFYGPRQLRRIGLRIGAHSRVNRDCCLDARGGLDIGDNVSVSPEVAILTASHVVNDPDFRVEVRRVTIENHVWIGTRALILPGVTLGRGCVVAAGSVVTRDVQPLTIVAGVPAFPVGMRAAEATHYVLDQPFPLFE